MGGWKKRAGFVIWCVLLFGGMIAAGTDLWPPGSGGSCRRRRGAGPVEPTICNGVCVPLLRRRVIGTGLPIIQVEPGWE